LGEAVESAGLYLLQLVIARAPSSHPPVGWIQILWNLHDDAKIGEVVGRAQEWWVNNSLYLDAQSRWLLKRAYLHATSFRHYRDMDATFVVRICGEIEEAGDAIVRGAALPPMGKDESRKLGDGTTS
jgi:hypothetical protein